MEKGAYLQPQIAHEIMGVAQAVEDELMGEEKEGEQAGYTNKGSSLIG